MPSSSLSSSSSVSSSTTSSCLLRSSSSFNSACRFNFSFSSSSCGNGFSYSCFASSIFFLFSVNFACVSSSCLSRDFSKLSSFTVLPCGLDERSVVYSNAPFNTSLVSNLSHTFSCFKLNLKPEYSPISFSFSPIPRDFAKSIMRFPASSRSVKVFPSTTMLNSSE